MVRKGLMAAVIPGCPLADRTVIASGAKQSILAA
jgi:hypothetical protein